MLVLTPGASVPRRRTPRDPKPRFKRDLSAQFDFVRGCPDAQVRNGHLARGVAVALERFDTSELEARYSALGRHGYHPRAILAVWVYASMIGVHHSTKVARLLETDAAFRLLSGGHAISGPTLRRFRNQYSEFISRAFEQSVRLGIGEGLADLKDLAIDSVRLRAHASIGAVRTVKRSTRRLAELAKLDTERLTGEELKKHEGKIEKHREGLEACERLGRSSFVKTNESAALMKFPNGAAAPGHRVTVTASGLKTRFVLSVMIDASTNDYGKLGPAVSEMKAVLARCGVPPGTEFQIAADPGYWSEEDLAFAHGERPNGADILVADPRRELDKRSKKPPRYFPKSLFVINEDGSATCPAGKKMKGPWTADKTNRTVWEGDGCSTCSLKPKCTPGRKRGLTASQGFEKARAAMLARMAEPGASDRYNRRIGTVEPVFSSVTDAMGYRRVSSRHPKAIVGEIMMKLLAHNIGLLIRAKERRDAAPPPPGTPPPLHILWVRFEI